MASIDAFWELAESEPARRPAIRLSLLRLAPGDRSTIDADETRQRKLILFAIAALHVLFLFALWAAMRPQPAMRIARDIPMQITIIERHAPAIVQKPLVTVVPRVQPTPVALPPNITKRPQALQVVTIVRKAAAVAPQTASAPPPLIYDAGGAPVIPESSAPPPTRDLLAHRSVSHMLPGGARPNSVDFHVRDGVSPEQVVNVTGRILSGLIANASHAGVNPNGMVTVAAGRGLRTSGRDTDPCDDVALDAMDLGADSKAREDADQRQQDDCVGH